jgi:hypothetical protein
MAPRVKIWEDVVYVAFDKQPWVAVNEDGTTETQWREPDGLDDELMSEEAAIEYVLDQLQELNLSKSTWKKITEHFGGTVD